MPFVRISLPDHISLENQEKISIAVHNSLIKTFNVPENDYFHVIEELKSHQMKYPNNYLGINHTQDIVFIQIIAAQGRSAEQKARLYSEIAIQITNETTVTKNNIIIVLTENNGFQNWSFGNGEIQEPKHLKK